MARLTAQEIETIRKRTKRATSGNRLTDMGAFEASAIVLTEDIPKLLAEVERLKSVIRHVNDCAEEFYEYENGVYVIPQHTPNRDFLQEIFVITAEEVDE